ncbi:MAG: hypothetical protein WDW38_001828 [Sanguina aurantia]
MHTTSDAPMTARAEAEPSSGRQQHDSPSFQQSPPRQQQQQQALHGSVPSNLKPGPSLTAGSGSAQQQQQQQQQHGSTRFTGTCEDGGCIARTSPTSSSAAADTTTSSPAENGTGGVSTLPETEQQQQQPVGVTQLLVEPAAQQHPATPAKARSGSAGGSLNGSGHFGASVSKAAAFEDPGSGGDGGGEGGMTMFDDFMLPDSGSGRDHVPDVIEDLILEEAWLLE